MILIIDNYDSFTYNLYQFIGSINPDIMVYRNDKITVEEIKKLAPTHLVISQGPKYPKDAGITLDAIKAFTGKIPILGICLGHQAIGEAFGGKVIRASAIYHGKSTPIRKTMQSPILDNLPNEFTAARYHSLIIDSTTLPNCLNITAIDYDGEIMAVSHKEHPTYGVQFHPESILTPHGMKIIKNFIDSKA